MAISTYADLKSAVANWVNRSDLTSRIPEFIALAESNISSDLRCRFNEKRITASISTQYFDVPTNFEQMRNFQLNTDPIQHLEYVTPEQMDLFRPDSTTGQPKVYSQHGQEFEVKPIPDTTYTAQMTYWYRLTAFSADNDTNDVLTNYPNLYLYGSLKHAQGYLEKGAPDFLSFYELELKKINRADRVGRFSGTKLNAKPRQIPE